MNNEQLDTLLNDELSTLTPLPADFIQQVMSRVDEVEQVVISAEASRFEPQPLPFFLQLSDFILPLIAAAFVGLAFMLWSTDMLASFDWSPPSFQEQLPLTLFILTIELIVGIGVYLYYEKPIS